MPTSDLERLTATLRASYERVWADVQAEETRLLADFTQANRSQKLRRLRDTRRTIEGLMDVADELALRWAFRDLPEAYQLGARQAAGTVGSAVSFTQVDVDAVNSLVLDTHESLLQATRGVKRSTKLLIETLARDHLSAKLIRGQTAEQAGRALAADLADHDIHAITYADGSKHGLADYADMLARTRSAEAYQTGGIEQTRALGVTYMEILDGIDCGWTSHNDTDKANGKIVTVDEAARFRISHPRCSRVASARPDLVSARDAREAVSHQTAAQRADQAVVEAGREQSVAARARAKRLDAQFQRRSDGLLDDRTSRVSPAAARAVARREARARRAS